MPKIVVGWCVLAMHDLTGSYTPGFNGLFTKVLMAIRLGSVYIVACPLLHRFLRRVLMACVIALCGPPHVARPSEVREKQGNVQVVMVTSRRIATNRGGD